MKNTGKKKHPFWSGMSSAVALSILIHAVLFVLAGMWIVFTVTKPEEKRFIPPKAVERPKMKLRKPKVKVKRTAKPRVTQRITTPIKRANLLDLHLPEMSDMADGLDGGVGGFDFMPEFNEVGLFGGEQSIGNDFVGTFYDFKRDRKSRPIPMTPDMFKHQTKEFIRAGWKISKLSRYYRSPKKLYATTFMIPPIYSTEAPAAFGEDDTLGYLFMLHYKGQLVHKTGITFRFWGTSGDMLIVRVDGEIVLNACWQGTEGTYARWQSSSADNRKYRMGFQNAVGGDWITLEPGVPVEMEVLVGEIPGGGFASMLTVQEEGVDYEKNRQGGPILPIFKTEEPASDLIEAIRKDLVIGEACVTNGPIFSDYGSSRTTGSRATTGTPAHRPSPATSTPLIPTGQRVWTMLEGRTFEAEFITSVANQLIAKPPRGRQLKIPINQLCEADRVFIELMTPPKFDITFSKTSSSRKVETSPYVYSILAPKIIDYIFKVRLKQSSAGTYNHDLRVEVFAIGEEIDGDNYILLERQEVRFNPEKQKQRGLEFQGEQIKVVDSIDLISKQRRGEKYGGYLVVVIDRRGKVIDHATSYKWVFKNLEKIRQVPTGKHFDKTGTRTAPPRPKRSY